ncbi:hypothetical protein D915_003700 [Fasciola hepatica]|uniref:EF-hand domain-containing protein n=1 Tax=Fasciola hepatica TaxID=6192 RepID=A0A4E0RAM9_FASHE|nr:hypothetical protein D915_003700 [Fasciola hepatica]
MLHLWTHKQNRPVRFIRSFLYALSRVFNFTFLHCIFSFFLSPNPNHQASRNAELSGHPGHSYAKFGLPINRDCEGTELLFSWFRIIHSHVYSIRFGLPRIGPGFIIQLLSSSSRLWLFMTVALTVSSCGVPTLADAAPLAQSPKATQSRKDEIQFKSHDSLRLTGIRPPTHEVLMPPFDLGFKGQTGSDSRKPSRAAGPSDYQSDAASNDPWTASSTSVSNSGSDQKFQSAGSQFGGRKDGRKFYHAQGKKKANGYGNPSVQVNRQGASYAKDPSVFEAAWNPYNYPSKSVKAPSSSSSYYSGYQNSPNNQPYPTHQDAAAAAYGPPLNQGPYPDNQQPIGRYQHPYIPWESPNYVNPSPMQPNLNQPMMVPYPYVQYDMGGRGMGEPYSQWETQAAYYQPPPQTYWNPYTQPQPGWFVAQAPILPSGRPIRFVPSNVPRPAEMRPTSVIGHPSNYREISREEMSQRVREYEQAQQTGANVGGDLHLSPLSNENLDSQNKDPKKPDAQNHDNGLVLTGSTAHDQVVRNFLGIASEWLVIGVDALFDEIDLNGDGAIRIDELRKFLRLHEAHIHR